MKIHFDFAIDFSENPAVQKERLSSVYELLKVNTTLRVGKVNQVFVNTGGDAYAFGADFQSQNNDIILMNEHPGDV